MNSFNSPRIFSLAALILTAVFLGGCVTTPKTYYYTLHGMPEAKKVPLADGKYEPGSYPHSVGVGPVILPELLIHPGVVSYSETQEVTVPLYHIWAGLLNEAVTRVLARDVSVLLDLDGVWPFPWDNRSRPERQVRIVVEELGGIRGGKVELIAKWRIVTNNGETVMSAHRGVYTTIAKDNSYDTYAKAINELVNLLSVDLAETLVKEI